MTNPALPGDETAITTQEAFEQVHAAKGWVLVEPAVKSKPAQAPKADSSKAGV